MSRLNRRQALAGFGSVSLGALLAACSGDEDDDTPNARRDLGEDDLALRRRRHLYADA